MITIIDVTEYKNRQGITITDLYSDNSILSRQYKPTKSAFARVQWLARHDMYCTGGGQDYTTYVIERPDKTKDRRGQQTHDGDIPF